MLKKLALFTISLMLLTGCNDKPIAKLTAKPTIKLIAIPKTPSADQLLVNAYIAFINQPSLDYELSASAVVNHQDLFSLSSRGKISKDKITSKIDFLGFGKDSNFNLKASKRQTYLSVDKAWYGAPHKSPYKFLKLSAKDFELEQAQKDIFKFRQQIFDAKVTSRQVGEKDVWRIDLLLNPDKIKALDDARYALLSKQDERDIRKISKNIKIVVILNKKDYSIQRITALWHQKDFSKIKQERFQKIQNLEAGMTVTFTNSNQKIKLNMPKQYRPFSTFMPIKVAIP